MQTVIIGSLCRSLAVRTLFISLVILLLITFNYFGHLLQDCIEGSLLISSVTELILISIITNLRLILPFSYFLAVLLELSALDNNNELIILFTNGLGKLRLLGLFALPSCIVFLLTGLLTLYIAPLANYQEKQLWKTHQERKSSSFIKLGEFIVLDKTVIYAEQQNKTTKEFGKVFLFYQDTNPLDPKQFAMLSKGIIDQTTNQTRYLELIQGQHLSFDQGQNLISRTTFDIYGLKLDIPPFAQLQDHTPSSTSTLELWHSQAHQDKAELQWRISLAILVLVLTLFAIAKINPKPRESSWAIIISGLLFFFCYMLTLNFIQSYLWKGTWPSSIGMWPVHLIALLYISIIFLKSK